VRALGRALRGHAGHAEGERVHDAVLAGAADLVVVPAVVLAVLVGLAVIATPDVGLLADTRWRRLGLLLVVGSDRDGEDSHDGDDGEKDLHGEFGVVDVDEVRGVG